MNAPRRIVCLVPSLTETLVHLGAGRRLVGRTRFCVEPAGAIDAVTAVGGTKDPDCDRILALVPDLVIVNVEENRFEDHDRLVEAGLCVHVTHPRTVVEAIAMIRELGVLLALENEAAALAAQCEQSLARARASAPARPIRVFCPIWRRPWMTFSSAPYVGNVLAVCGLSNVFGARRGPDFFEVTLEEVARTSPELILLPDEPYPFRIEHAKDLRAAGIGAAAVCIDGKDLAWYGPRIPAALDRLCTVGRQFPAT